MKTKAFTLSELLVVVIIIAVLAAVVLPKFTKIIQMRKVSEAQEMMFAVRNEQEARCALNKNYLPVARLQVFQESNNFTFSDNETGGGMIATPVGEQYRLEMPSYADGRLCCSKGCWEIDRKYPTCSELEASSDYVQPAASCQLIEEDTPTPPGTQFPQGKVEMEGICCLPEQFVKAGKCLYKYRPNRFNIGVLVNCHNAEFAIDAAGGYISEEQFNSDYMGYKSRYGTYEAYKEAVKANYGAYAAHGPTARKPSSCSVMNYAYYRGGKLPDVSAGSGCEQHHAYYYGGPWWNGGERIEGNNVYGSDQDWCDSNCGPFASCSKKGIISTSAPNQCGAYHCSNGWHCDNAEGTGVALECIRE